MNYSLKIPIGRFCYKDNAYLCMQNEESMKNIAWILVVIAMIAGCSETRHPLLKEAADIVHQHPDSALALISRVDTASLSGADKMEYRLLKIMTDYIVLHQADGDSLITTCVDYYDKHGDAWHRAGHTITGVASEGIYSTVRLMPSRIIRWPSRLQKMQMTNC